MAAAVTRPRVAAPPPSSQLVPKSFWPWFIQRVTGVCLVGLLAVHIIVEHFGNLDKVGSAGHKDLIVFSDVEYRLAQALWWGIDVGLLAFVLFHGFNGIRNIAIDMGITQRAERVVTAVLTRVGLAGLGFGIAALIAFRQYT